MREIKVTDLKGIVLAQQKHFDWALLWVVKQQHKQMKEKQTILWLRVFRFFLPATVLQAIATL